MTPSEYGAALAMALPPISDEQVEETVRILVSVLLDRRRKPQADSTKRPESGPEVLERRLLDYTRAAAYLGISVRSMKALGGPNGDIPRVEIGTRVLFDKADLDAYIERCKRS